MDSFKWFVFVSADDFIIIIMNHNLWWTFLLTTTHDGIIIDMTHKISDKRAHEKKRQQKWGTIFFYLTHAVS